jgi:hypothetical protein
MIDFTPLAAGVRGGVEQWNSRAVGKKEGKEFLVLSF